jgi:hypothetical protein
MIDSERKQSTETITVGSRSVEPRTGATGFLSCPDQKRGFCPTAPSCLPGVRRVLIHSLRRLEFIPGKTTLISIIIAPMQTLYQDR